MRIVKIKKITLTLGIVSLMMASLFGCGKKNEDKADNTNSATTVETGDSGEASDTSLAGNSRFIYNGVEFGVGDKADEVIPKLGDQIKPSEKSQPCVPDAGMIETFSFDGFIIQVTESGIIYSINLNNESTSDNLCTTVGGIKIGSTLDEVKKALGDPADENEYGLTYQDGELYLSFVIDDDGKMMSITVEDMSIDL